MGIAIRGRADRIPSITAIARIAKTKVPLTEAKSRPTPSSGSSTIGQLRR